MKAEEIREGDIVEIDYIAEFTKEHINEGEALVIWKGHNNQPLVRKLSTKKTIWTCYEHIARVVGHIDIEGYMDKALNTAENEDKEEAIEILKAYRYKLTSSVSNLLDEDIKAFDLAIKALEQEPCDKCVYSTKDGYCQYDDITEAILPYEVCETVSRQAALDCLTATGLKKFDFILDARDKIKNLPSVKPQVICPGYGINCKDCPAYELKESEE